MRTGFFLLALVLLVPLPAQAGLSPQILNRIGANLPANARLDISLSAQDTTGTRRTLRSIMGGRPAFIAFADYTCRTLCGTELMLLADGIQRARLDPDAFRILVIGIDPRDSAAAALKMEDTEIPAALRPSAIFLLPDARTVARATGALGYRFAYDAAIDQFAHPAIIYALAPDGHVRGMLSPLSLTGGDMRQALQGSPTRPSGLSERIRLLCYGYDAATGIYTLQIGRLLKLAALLTVAALAVGLLLLSRRRRSA